MTYFVWASIFSLFGFAYFGYGKKQGRSIPLYIGIVLIIFPYFIVNLYVMIPIGVVLIIFPLIYKGS